jgi:hypothetical protein
LYIAEQAETAGRKLLNRGAGIRTRDLLLPKQARYRTAPHPVVERRWKLTTTTEKREVKRYLEFFWSVRASALSALPLWLTASFSSSVASPKVFPISSLKK